MPRQPRIPQPWQRKDRDGAWYVTIRQRQKYLAPADATPAQVQQALASLLMEANIEVKGDEGALLPISGRYCDWVKANQSESTYRIRRLFLQDFWRYAKVADCLGLTAKQIKPHHLTQWTESRPKWSSGTRRVAMETVLCFLNWSFRQGYLESNPLAGKVRVPAATSRGSWAVMDEAAYELWLSLCKTDSHRHLLVALYRTGCRPSEICSVGLEDGTDFNEQAQSLTVRGKRTRGNPTGLRNVLLDPVMMDLCRKLRAKHQGGPLFRNAWEKPCDAYMVAQVFRNLRKRAAKADPERADYHKRLVPYACRHTFATTRLKEGHSDAMVAKLLGHRGTAILHRHYNHVMVEDARSVVQSMSSSDREKKIAGGG